MAKPSPWEKQQNVEQTTYDLKQVSIKRLYLLEPFEKVSSEDFEVMMGRAEGLWGSAVQLVDYIESVIKKSSNPEIIKKLTEINEEVKKVQSFAFDLTEY